MFRFSLFNVFVAVLLRGSNNINSVVNNRFSTLPKSLSINGAHKRKTKSFFRHLMEKSSRIHEIYEWGLQAKSALSNLIGLLPDILIQL